MEVKQVKYNPLTNTLYTDDGHLIKQMYCPYNSIDWDRFSLIDGSMDRYCDICESTVLDTKELTDDMLLKLLKNKPDTCLKIDFDQENIRIIHV